jgi:hypothetical protein
MCRVTMSRQVNLYISLLRSLSLRLSEKTVPLPFFACSPLMRRLISSTTLASEHFVLLTVSFRSRCSHPITTSPFPSIYFAIFELPKVHITWHSIANYQLFRSAHACCPPAFLPASSRTREGECLPRSRLLHLCCRVRIVAILLLFYSYLLYILLLLRISRAKKGR